MRTELAWFRGFVAGLLFAYVLYRELPRVFPWLVERSLRGAAH